MNFIVFLILCIIFPLCAKQEIFFDKVVIWGYKLHSHTHSYIHDSFYKAFENLGYETYWFDDNDRIENFDFERTLFLTMGNDANRKMPLLESCYYLLHNCDQKRFQFFYDTGHALTFQVYTHNCTTQHTDIEKIDECIYASHSDKTIYMPWATDLLPHQIDDMKTEVIKQWGVPKEKTIYWIGTMIGGLHGNIEQLSPFIAASKSKDYKFKHIIKISPEENKKLIFNSIIAPTIVGKWQCEQGYVPCRIFKNISYGRPGVTNSETVYNLFQKKIIYNPDPKKLFYDAQEKIKTLELQELLDLMDMVKKKHTYINRVELLINFLQSLQRVF